MTSNHKPSTAELAERVRQLRCAFGLERHTRTVMTDNRYQSPAAASYNRYKMPSERIVGERGDLVVGEWTVMP